VPAGRGPADGAAVFLVLINGLFSETDRVPPPTVLGLTICEKVIVEEGTNNLTLVSTFTKLTVSGFPSPPQRFAVYTVLTDGVGDATIDLVVTRLDTTEEVYARRQHVRYPNKLIEARVLFRVSECSFPAPGRYQATLLVDGEWVAQRWILVAAKED
jgi:hypothetical protein